MPTTLDAYLAALSPGVRTVVDEVRRIVVDEFPAATESISYDIPTFSLQGKRLVHVAGWAKHVSVYPVPTSDDQLLSDLGPYLSGKGTLKFLMSEPIPYDLIRRVVQGLGGKPR
jgi:uncharacterized protein YdhG (YjbR/CyaY superfamily)